MELTVKGRYLGPIAGAIGAVIQAARAVARTDVVPYDAAEGPAVIANVANLANAANVKGSALASRLLWIKINQGQQGIERLRKTASDELADLLEHGAVMSKWYPFKIFVEVNVSIDKVFGKGDLALIRELGRHGADANLTTIYRLFYKVGTVKWILTRASRLWGMHYDSGALEMETMQGRAVRAEIKDFAAPHRVHCLAVQAWAERSVELSGGRDVVVAEDGCRASGDETCAFRLEWS